MKKISANGLNYIKQIEKFSPKVYLDQGGFATIGYGHLITKDESSSGKIKIGNTFIKYNFGLIESQASTLLDQDCDFAENAVNQYVTTTISQNEFDALVSFVFNVGASAFKNSTLLKKINQGLKDDVPSQFMRWIYTNGIKSKGLERRRKEESKIYILGVYQNG